ncbi:MAG TPA: hypothetical protein PLG90_10675 [Ignavibacteria bacterium]|nr:hypothetical protein [Ignavibacteria bacterium]
MSDKLNNIEEKITAYIDGNLTPEESKEFELIIQTDNDIYNRYQMELAVKSLLKSKIKNRETPQYIYQNIHNAVNEEFESKLKKVQPVSSLKNLNVSRPQLNQKKYFYFFASTFAVLIILFIAINFNKTDVNIPPDKDMVERSIQIFDQINAGDIQIQFKTNNASDLEKFFKEKCDYEVFVPDVKDATLLGGVYNEMNGLKAVHFVHQIDNQLIYTLQLKKKDVVDKENPGIMLAGPLKDEILEGKNWFPCIKKHPDNVMIWQKDDVVCTSVSKLNNDVIHTTLTNFKQK